MDTRSGGMPTIYDLHLEGTLNTQYTVSYTLRDDVNYTLKNNLTIGSSGELTIQTGKKLFIPPGKTLTINKGGKLIGDFGGEGPFIDKNLETDTKIFNTQYTLKYNYRLNNDLTIGSSGELTLEKKFKLIIPKGKTLTINKGGKLIGNIKEEVLYNTTDENLEGTLNTQYTVSYTVSYKLHDNIHHTLKKNLTIGSSGELTIQTGKKLFVPPGKTLTINKGGKLIGGPVDTRSGVMPTIYDLHLEGTLNTQYTVSYTLRDGVNYTLKNNLTIGSSGELTIPKDKKLLIPDGKTLTINKGGKLSGTVEGEGKIIDKKLEGTLNMNYTLTRNMSLYNDLTIEESGELTIQTGKTLTIPDGKTLTINEGGKINGTVEGKIIDKNLEGTLNTKYTLFNNMSLYNDLTIEESGELTIQTGKTLTIPDGKTLTINEGGKINGTVEGKIIDKNLEGTLNTKYTLFNNMSLYNDLTIEESGELTVNKGVVFHIRNLTIKKGGLIKKEGEIIIYGKFIDENIDDSFNQYYTQRADKTADKTDVYQKIYYLRSNYTLKGDLIIPKDKTLNIPTLKTLIVPKGKTLTIDTDGKLEILGDIIVNGTVKYNKMYEADGWEGVFILGIDYTLNNDVTIKNGKTLTVSKGKTLTIPNGKKLTIVKGGTLEILGDVVNNGTIIDEDELPTKAIKDTKDKSKTIDLKLTKNATIYTDYKLKNNLTIPTGITLTVLKGKTLTINENYNLIIQKGGTLEILGDVVNNGTITENLPTEDIKDKSKIIGLKLTKNATIYTDYTLKDNLTIPKGITLTVSKGKTLTVSKGKTLTINEDGILKIDENGLVKGDVNDEHVFKVLDGTLKKNYTLLADYTLKKALDATKKALDDYYNLTIPKGKTFTVSKDKTLILKRGMTLIIEEDGILKLEKGGKLTIQAAEKYSPKDEYMKDSYKKWKGKISPDPDCKLIDLNLEGILNNKYTLPFNYTLTKNLIIPFGKKLTLPKSNKLTVPKKYSLIILAGGDLENKGDITFYENIIDHNLHEIIPDGWPSGYSMQVDYTLITNLTIPKNRKLIVSKNMKLTIPKNYNLIIQKGGDLSANSNVVVRGTVIDLNLQDTLIKNITLSIDYILNNDLIIPSGLTLKVGNGAKLTIPKGKTITIQQGGKLEDLSGSTIINNGTIKKKLPTKTITDVKGEVLTRDWTIHYNHTLDKNLVIPSGLKFTVGERAKLIIPDNLNITIKQGGKLEDLSGSTIINKELIIDDLPTDKEGNLTRDATIWRNYIIDKQLIIPNGITLKREKKSHLTIKKNGKLIIEEKGVLEETGAYFLKTMEPL